MKKKLFCIIACLVLLCSMLPIQVLAVDVINVFAVTGLTLPANGAAPDFTAGIVQTDCCKVVSVRWMDLWTDSWMSANDRFVKEEDEYGNKHEYRVEITIELLPGNQVSSNQLYITVNDSEIASEYEFTTYCTDNDRTVLVIEGDYIPTGSTGHTCSGGYATCIAAAKCSTCGKEYGRPNPENHDVFGYEKANSDSKYATHHDVKCDLCKKMLYEEAHTWGPLNHDNVRPCIVCWYTPEAESSDHTCSGGYATCIAAAKCSTCGKEYGSPNPENHDVYGYEKANSDSKYATHHDVKCDLCKKSLYEEDHSWGPLNHNNVRPCIVCWYTPEAGSSDHTCSGGEATCAEKAICSTCGEEYGDLDENAHTYLDTYAYSDERGHAKSCLACGKASDFEAHAPSDSDKNKCKICDGVIPQETEITESTPSVETTGTPEKPQPSDGNNTGSSTRKILAITGGVAGTGGAAVASYYVLKKKFRKK